MKINILALNVYGKLPSSKIISNHLNQLVRTLSVTPLATVKHVFDNDGYTELILLAESHIAIHTWPESNYFWIEIATCGDVEDTKKMTKYIQELDFVTKIEKDVVKHASKKEE